MGRTALNLYVKIRLPWRLKPAAGTNNNNKLNTKIMKEEIKNFGEFNNWRGCMGLYFSTKQLRPLKKYGITAATTLKEAYNTL